MLLGGLAIIWSAAGAGDQSNSMVVHVVPETSIDPSQILLQFAVPSDRTQSVPAQTTRLTVRARVLPAQTIRVRATLGDVTGPTGSAPASIGWTGSRTAGTGGGKAGACTSGETQAKRSADLVSNWAASGAMTCALQFALSNASELPPGQYRGTLSITLLVAEE